MKITSAANVPPPAGDLVANGGDEDRNVFEREFHPEAEVPSSVIVDAVAFIHNVDAVELDPLATVLDPEALDGLLASGATDDASTVEVSFSFEGLQISVTGDGCLWLRWKTE